MIDRPAAFIAMTGTAFLVASYASAAIETRVTEPAPKAAVVGTVSAKGDRLDRARPAAERAPVALVEVVGVSQVAVVLKGRDGSVLYSSDPLSNTTVVAKDADLPVVTLTETASVPVVQNTPAAPAATGTQEGREGTEQPTNAPRKPRTIGCETVVSPLVRNSAGREPSRCVVELDTGRMAS